MKFSNIKIANCIMLLRKLLSIDTCNPPGNESNLVNEILKLLNSSRLNVEVFSHGENRSSLVLELAGKCRTTKIGFAGHLDTVPVGNPGEWSYQPFEGICQDGFLYGRGASDMCGGLTAMLMLILQYTNNGIIPPVTLKFFFTADEEAGGTGITALRENGCFDDMSFLFICEPTECRPGVAEKGAIWLGIESIGKSSHASMPEKGINALEHGICFISRIKELIQATGSHSLLGKNTCSITGTSSGIKTNIIPDKAIFYLDIRIVPNLNLENDKIIETIRAEIGYYMRKNPGVNLSINVINNRNVLEVNQNNRYIDILKQTYNTLNLNFDCCAVNFFTDASLLIPYKNIPFIILGPGDPCECHAINEKIKVEDILQAVEIYHTFINSLGKL